MSPFAFHCDSLFMTAREHVRDRGGLIFDARAMRAPHNAEALAPLLQAIRQRLATHGDPPLYPSLEIDVPDPAFAPGTGTPQPSGLSTDPVPTLPEQRAALPFVGVDCVEVSPPSDPAELTAQVAAHVVWSYLCGRIARTA